MWPVLPIVLFRTHYGTVRRVRVAALTGCGRGLPAALRDHIGEPFLTTEALGQGMGLGLYRARTILARLGGQLELSEREPSGVVEGFVLPLSPLLAARPA